jgi:hypothetical protein
MESFELRIRGKKVKRISLHCRWSKGKPTFWKVRNSKEKLREGYQKRKKKKCVCEGEGCCFYVKGRESRL